jgi:hypothetical protein
MVLGLFVGCEVPACLVWSACARARVGEGVSVGIPSFHREKLGRDDGDAVE